MRNDGDRQNIAIAEASKLCTSKTAPNVDNVVKIFCVLVAYGGKFVKEGSGVENEAHPSVTSLVNAVMFLGMRCEREHFRHCQFAPF